MTSKTTAAIREYLEKYFSVLDEEYVGLYGFWASALKTIAPSLPTDARALELGVGPTLYTTVPLAKYFKTIDLADFVGECFDSINAWLQREPDAFDWGPCVELCLKLEGEAATPQAVQHRESLMRNAISETMLCDMRTESVLHPSSIEHYDLVTAHYCTEVTAASPNDWANVIHNISGLVKPGGWIMLSVCQELRNRNGVFEAEPSTPFAEISGEFAKGTLVECGVQLDSIMMKHLPAPVVRPYTATTLICGRTSS